MDVRRAAPLGSFGLVAGLAAAATFLPDGCSITSEGSQHLREGVPLVTPLLFGLLGLVLAKKARWATLQAFGTLALWALVIALLGTGRVNDTPYAAMILGALAVATLVVPPVVARAAEPWPWVAALEGMALLGFWGDPRRSAHESFDFGLAWSAIGAHVFVTLTAALMAPRPWRARSAILVGLAIGAALVCTFLVLHAPAFVPSHSEPFTIWHGC